MKKHIPASIYSSKYNHLQKILVFLYCKNLIFFIFNKIIYNLIRLYIYKEMKSMFEVSIYNFSKYNFIMHEEQKFKL